MGHLPRHLLTLHFARRIAPWLVALVAYLLVATALVRWDMSAHGEKTGDFVEDAYGMYTQVFFQPTHVLPRSPVARFIYWITPLLGVGLLLRGLTRVGATLFDADERRKLWVKVMSERMKDHTIVCGLGHVGIRVVESLQQLGTPVVAIEKTRDDRFDLLAVEIGVPVLYGDARRDTLLVEAGVKHARAIVCATNDDLTNLEVAIDSKRFNPAIRVIVRIFDQRVAEKMRSALDVDETFSTSALSGPLVALQATEPGVRGCYRLDDGSLRVGMEVPTPKGWVGKTVAACEDIVDGRIVGIKMGGRFGRAKHDIKLADGDVLTLDLPAANVAKIRS
jgi:voltage-gated potassium channel